MKELFCKLIESTQKNEISAVNAFKLWAIILVLYWVFVGCVFFVSLIVSFIASNIVEFNILYFMVHTVTNFIGVLYLFVFFIFFYFVITKYRMPFNLTESKSMSFASVPHMFVFSVLIWGIIQMFNLFCEIIIIFCLQNNFNYWNSAQGMRDMMSYLPIMFVFKLLVSLLGFVVFRKMLQLGWCGVRVEKK